MPRVSGVLPKKGALDSQPQVIKFTSCLPMVGGSAGTPASSTTKTGRHDIAESGVIHQKSNQSSENTKSLLVPKFQSPSKEMILQMGL